MTNNKQMEIIKLAAAGKIYLTDEGKAMVEQMQQKGYNGQGHALATTK